MREINSAFTKIGHGLGYASRTVPIYGENHTRFLGVVSIELKRFLDSGVALVECPDCARTRSLSARKGVLRFPSHDKGKISTSNTEQRWAMCETIWEVVGGESK